MTDRERAAYEIALCDINDRRALHLPLWLRQTRAWQIARSRMKGSAELVDARVEQDAARLKGTT